MGKERGSAEETIRDIRRKTRRQHSAEEKIRIVMEGLRGEDTIAELCRREGIADSLYYKWSKEFLEAGKARLAGDTKRQAEQETRDTYELKRLLTVRLYGSGVERRTIENLMGCDERSIRKWAQRYTQQGLDGLKSQWQSENALKLSRQQRAELKARLHHSRPDQIIATDIRVSRRQFWTVSDVQIVVEHWLA